MIRLALVLLALLALTAPATPQSSLLLVGVTNAAPPSCVSALNLSQPCNAVNLDLLF